MPDVIGLFGVLVGGTQNAMAQVDIPMDGFLVSVDWDVHADLDADGETVEVELSFIATNQITTNDVRGRIASVSARAAVLTAVGVSLVSIQKQVIGLEIPVSGGERIYLHALSAAGVLGNVRCNVLVDLGTTTRRSARRR